ncbi:tRNA (uracil-O(2)-)-methyltransferase [Erysiphe necator]|uniref:tRNA (uracil-O(2)-)-methyltransferase n=1 Tax=Uncinula necator TaxID=52586 RepID=A0A0B1PA36_UNCNE|nr:tRNA (uracil-O(2)-)-methyltransferase [Erysiphe necator]KHJ35118.1 putative trna (uracil-o -)-methyltransferase [Erysiphe necator]
MGFAPTSIPPGTAAFLTQETENRLWTPLFKKDCTFPPETFHIVMRNLVQNPNINSTYLFRADILVDLPFSLGIETQLEGQTLRVVHFKSFQLKKVILRTLIPRNIRVGKPLDQTCLFYENKLNSSKTISLVVYLPHISCESESPFYHPAVYGISFLHEFCQATQMGEVSIHYCFFDSEPRSVKLERTAYHLLATLYKHGQGTAAGYIKRVHHDVILPQNIVQNTYSRLKLKYSRKLIENWVESTDPTKHVFEDLGIAAFLIELWNEIYKDKKFPGFVDIGCGNGLLVHILREEGYTGWGFDARYRKSWSTYSKLNQENLKEMVLIPFLIDSITTCIPEAIDASEIEALSSCTSSCTWDSIREKMMFDSTTIRKINRDNPNLEIHSGIFPKNVFIISNHADELTPWTPLLATASQSSFIVIPCCSHDLNGARKRAPYVKNHFNKCSSYALLVEWVSQIVMDCGWEVEKEVLRIPSTRNTAIIGRTRTQSYEAIDLKFTLEKHGGASDWVKNTLKLLSKSSCKSNNSRVH